MYHQPRLAPAFGAHGDDGAAPAFIRRAAAAAPPGRWDALRDWLDRVELAPDLGANVGTARWWRGLCSLLALVAAALLTHGGAAPLTYPTPPTLDARTFDEVRAQRINPLAFGGDSGRHMAATDAVRPLAQAPERPQIEQSAVIGRGDSFVRVLERSGVGSGEARQIAARLAAIVPLDQIAPGTRVQMILGRRPVRTIPRPVEAISLRARFDLRVEFERSGAALALRRVPILVDDTPLRVRGRAGSSLYRAARAAGVPAAAVQQYLRVVGPQLGGNLAFRPDDEFDIVTSYRRAETGETEAGKLLYAGLVRGGKQRLSMIEWTSGGQTQWFEASGVGRTRGALVRPTAGRITSNYGMRRHPILGYVRMHSGIDFGGGYGAPIYAVSDGTVTMAGRRGAYGNYVRISHGGGLGSGYGHMSRIAVAPGQRVRAGQLIGTIGSTGLSTGPHLHYELYRNGQTVNPNSVSFVTRSQLEGAELAAFRARIRELTAVAPGAALSAIAPVAPPEPTVGSLADTAAKRAGGMM